MNFGKIIKGIGWVAIIGVLWGVWYITTMDKYRLYETLEKSHNSPTIVGAFEVIGGPTYNEVSWYWVKSAFAMPDDYKDIEHIRENAYTELIRLSNINLGDERGWLREEVVLELMLISIREKTLTTKGLVINKYVDINKGIAYLDQLAKMNEDWLVLYKKYNTPERLSAWGNFRLKTKKQRSTVGITEEEHFCGDIQKHPRQKGYKWVNGECGL